MVTKIADKFCSFLNEHCSKFIWNEPQREFRHNIKLALQMKRPQINAWTTGKEIVSLPISNRQFFVYATPLNHFAGLDVGSSDWQTVTTLLNKRIQLRFHDSTGRRLVSGCIYIRTSSVDKNTILIAIDAKMLNKVAVGKSNDLFIGVYFDSDDVNDVTSVSYKATASNRQLIVNASESATVKFVNGLYVKGSLTADSTDTTKLYVKDDDYVELFTDENVIGSFTIDLSNDNDSRVYISEKDGQLKNIIHIPKALNPGNHIISHDTCDFFIYPRNLATNYKIGRYFHRAQGSEDRSFIQLTHNDFGVPTTLIDSFGEYLGADELVIDCYVRRHSRTKTLQRDKHYLDYLYQLDDNTILDFLEGKASANIPFWQAEKLEMSNYMAIVKDTSEQLLKGTLKFYTEALGYTNTASLLSQRVFRYTGISGYDGKDSNGNKYKVFDIGLPIAFQWKECVNSDCQNAVPIVDDVCPECGTHQPSKSFSVHCYLNGVKFRYSQIIGEIITNNQNIDDQGPYSLHVTVELGNRSLVATDELVFELCENSDFKTYIFNPVQGNNKMYVTPGKYKCYKKSTVAPVDSVAGPVSDTYTLVNLETFTLEKKKDLYVYTCPDELLGSELIIQTVEGLGPNNYSDFYDIQSYVSNNVNLYVVPHDDGHRIYSREITPSAIYASLTEQLNGVNIYKYENGEYTDVTDTCVVSFNNGNLVVTFNTNLYGKLCLAVFYSDPIDVPVLVDQNYVMWLNGRELVENVDYMKIRPAANMPYQYVINNVSYLKTSNNFFELYGSNDYSVGRSANFRTSSTSINSKQTPLLFYDKFTSVATDGNQLAMVRWANGRLYSDSTVVPTRHGALFTVRSEIPGVIREQMNPERFVTGTIDYLAEDIERFNKIVDYFCTITSDDPAIYDIPMQHKVYSVYLNKVIDDVLDGALTIPAGASESQLTALLVDYEYLKRFDLPLMFTTETTSVQNWNGNTVNRTVTKSVINRDFIDVYPHYTQRLIPNHMYLTINRLIDMTVPEDTVVYTEAVDTSVDDNQGNR